MDGESFDAAVSTLPLSLLSKLATGELAGKTPLVDLRYQGVVNVVLLSRKQLQPYYWTAVVDPSFPFQGVVETTNLIPTEWPRQASHVPDELLCGGFGCVPAIR